MAYIVTIGAPADTAASVLVNLALACATESQLRTLQDDVERDINAVNPAGLAVIARALGVLKEIDAVTSRDGGVPGTE